MKSYNSIEERIDILQSRIEAYQDEIETLETEPKNNNERIMKLPAHLPAHEIKMVLPAN